MPGTAVNVQSGGGTMVRFGRVWGISLDAGKCYVWAKVA